MARNEVSWQATKAIRYPEFSVNSIRSPREDIGYGGRGEPRVERGYGELSASQRGTKRSSDYNSPPASYKSQRMNDDIRHPFSSTGPEKSGIYQQRDFPSPGNQGSGDNVRYEAQRQGNRPEFTEQPDRYGPQRFPSGNERNLYPDKGEMRKIDFDDGVNYLNKFPQNRDSRSDYPFDNFSRRPTPQSENFPRGSSGLVNDSQADERWQSDMFTRRRPGEDSFLNPRDDDRKPNVDRERYNDALESRRIGIDQILNDSEYKPVFDQRGIDDKFKFQGDWRNLASFPNRGGDSQPRNDFNRGGFSKFDFQPDRFGKGSLPISGSGGQIRSEPEFSQNPGVRSFRTFELQSNQSSSGLLQTRRLGQFVNESVTNKSDFGPPGRRDVGADQFLKEAEFRGNLIRETDFRDSKLSDQGFFGPPGARRDKLLNEPEFRSTLNNERDNRSLQNVGPPNRGVNTDGDRFNQSEFKGDFNDERNFRNSEFRDQRIVDLAPTNDLGDFRSNSFQRREFNDNDFPMDRGGGNRFSIKDGNDRFRNEPDIQRGGIDHIMDERRFGQNRSGFNEQRNFNPGFGRDDFDRLGFDNRGPRRDHFNDGRNLNEFERFNQRVNAFRQGENNQTQNPKEFGNHYFPNKKWIRGVSDRQSNFGEQKLNDSPGKPKEFDRNSRNPEGFSSERGGIMGRPKTEPPSNKNNNALTSSNKPEPAEPVVSKSINENATVFVPNKQTVIKTEEVESLPQKSSEPDWTRDDIDFLVENQVCTKKVTSRNVELGKIRKTKGPVGNLTVFLCVASEAPMLTLQRSATLLKKKFVYNNRFDPDTATWTATILFDSNLLATVVHAKKDEARIKALNITISLLRKHYYFVKRQGEYYAAGLVLAVHGRLVSRSVIVKKALSTRFKNVAVPNVEAVKKAIYDYAESDCINDLELSFEFGGSPRKQIMIYAQELGLIVRKYGPKLCRYVVISKKYNIWEIVKGLVERDERYLNVYELLAPGEGHLF